MKDSLGREPRWNADRCALPVWGRGRARKARQNTHCVCRRFASEFLSFVLSRSSSMPERCLRMLPPAFACRSSAWTTASSAVVTSKRQWLAIARMLRRIARTRFYFHLSPPCGERSDCQRVRPEGAGPMTSSAIRVRGLVRESELGGNAPSSQPSPRKRGEVSTRRRHEN